MMRATASAACYFAPRPPPSPPALLARAEALRPDGMYTTRAACLEVLTALRDEQPAWWDQGCSDFVEQVRTSLTAPPPRHPVIVVEGLDGAGKTTLTAALAKKLGAAVLCTPNPELDAVRGKFRVLEEPFGRAFYGGANYVAAAAIAEAAQHRPVVVDRWYGSTASMALALRDAPLPAPGAAVYQWPTDLPAFTLGVLLDVPEEVRVQRMKRRGDENAEEVLLRQKAELRDRAREAYHRMGLYRDVCAPTYMHMTNEILAALADKGVLEADEASSLSFSAAEVAECRPY